MTYQEIKDKKQADYNKLFDTCGVFWAFSNEQFKEGYEKVKPTMAEGEKLVGIGGGGYLPKHNVEALMKGMKGMKEIDETFKAQIKEFKMREKHILYELNNHECFYTGDITNAVEAMGEDYTREEVMEVMKKYKAKKYARPTVESDYIGESEKDIINTCDSCGKDTPNELKNELCPECRQNIG